MDTGAWLGCKELDTTDHAHMHKRTSPHSGSTPKRKQQGAVKGKVLAH